MRRYGLFTDMLMDISRDIYKQMNSGKLEKYIFAIPGGKYYEIEVKEVNIDNGRKVSYAWIDEVVEKNLT